MDEMDTVRAHPVARLLLASLAVSLLVLGALWSTSSMLPMAWDEGNAILRAEAIGQGDWQYTTVREGHPAFYGMVIAAGQWIAGGWTDPLRGARSGPMALFALGAGAMFYRMAREYSLRAGVGAVAALVLLPRMFAHAHFASFDGPLSSGWILAWATFPLAWRGAGAGVRSQGQVAGQTGAETRRLVWSALPWGVALGIAFSCKATGWLAALPCIAWAALYRDRWAFRTLAVGLPVACLTFFVLNPPLWRDPIGGWATFFWLNLNRGAQPGLNISTWFLGELYNLDYPLPWYNTVLWTAITAPLGVLMLAVGGAGSVLRRWRSDRSGVFLVGNWMVLVVVRALPGTPPHDAERLILPSFAFLAALAGLGTDRVLTWAAQRWSQNRRARWFALGTVCLLYAGSATSLFWYAPQWLSYYNVLIGGLRGAARAGMESTYYWDALDRPVLDWLHAHTATGEKICFGAGSYENLVLMQRWGQLRRDVDDDAPGEFRWYVLQHRPGAWQAVDWWLVEHGRPAYRKTLGEGGFGPWRGDVPLIEVYPFQQYLQGCYISAKNSP